MLTPSKILKQLESTEPEQPLTELEKKWEKKETEIKIESEKPLTDPQKDKNLVLLANYNKNCKKCYGRGYEGIYELKPLKEKFMPCSKCSKNSWTWLNIRNGNLRYDK